MRQQYPNSSDPRPIPRLDYSRYLSDGTEWTQGLSGMATFLAAFAGWYPVARRLTTSTLADTPRNALLTQLAWAAVCLAAVLVVDLLARNRWGWDRFRIGLILGAFAVGGFWIVRGLLFWYQTA